jgi:hypothetical protein
MANAATFEIFGPFRNVDVLAALSAFDHGTRSRKVFAVEEVLKLQTRGPPSNIATLTPVPATAEASAMGMRVKQQG